MKTNKNISLTLETYNALLKLKEEGQSFTGVIKKLLKRSNRLELIEKREGVVKAEN